MTLFKNDLLQESGPVLSGFAFARSQMSPQSFTVYAFGQLLTVPRDSDSVSLALSRKLGDYFATPNIEDAMSTAALMLKRADAPI